MKFNEYTTAVKCHACGHTGQYVMRTLIDTAKDKDAVNQILDARWFTYTCPQCKERTIVTHTCLFHDTERKVLIALADSEEDYEEISGWMKGTYQKDELEQALLNMMRGSDCRLVTNLHEFQEKVLLHVLQMDDKVIEMCKVMTEMILVQNQIVDHVEHMYFNTDGDEYVFMIDTGEEDMASTQLPKGMVKDVTKMIADSNPPESFVIDRTWAMKQLHVMA